MALPKFLTFYQSLDSKQIFHFRKFVLSYIGPETEAYGVLEVLSARQDWKERYPGNEAMAAHCLASGHQKTYLNYLSMLYDIAQEWMALDQLRKEPYEQDLLVQRWLNRKGLHQQAEQVRARVLRNLDEEVGVDYKLDRYRSEVNFEYLFCNNPDMNDYREEDYRDMLQGFDAYFSGKAAMMMCEVSTFSKYFRVDMSKDIRQMEGKMNGAVKSKIVDLTQLAYKMISKPDTRLWVKLSDALLNGEVRRGSLLNSVLSRYCVKSGINLWSKDKHKDVARIAAIAQYGLNTGVYAEEGKMSPSSFHNLVATLCQALNEKEMLTFVKKWSKEVDPRFKEAALKIGTAQVYFYKEKYHNIKHNTNVVELSPNQRYLAQGLDLIAAFENRKKDEATYKRQVHNFNNYLRYNKDKMSAEALTKYRNMYRLMRDIDAKPGKLSMDDYNPVFYRKYCMRCLENKNGGL
ncbi:MAG: hypothetical protein KA767_01835 [Saprospiraceae bacterium]|jgi:hypothetical protein|nr:hypothetical protein [Saprospiraceae bacterium]MBP9195291.1 hypothetical protein [Saprospiraceae bacterium]